MNQLAFQPAFDVFHTEFRFLRLRRLMGADFIWQYDQLRIADFYLLFFFRLQNARLAPQHRSIKAQAKNCPQPSYEKQPDDQILFSRMATIQRAAAETLVVNGFFDSAEFKLERLVETGKVEPEALCRRIDEINEEQTGRMEALSTLISSYDLLGENGLKARTGLLEYRYDAV